MHFYEQQQLFAGVSLSNLSAFCNKNHVKLIHCCVRGIFFRVFCDFGSKYEVRETDEQNPDPVLISKITNDDEGLVTCIVDKTHGFQVGDKGAFYDVENMGSIGERRVLSIVSSTQFKIGSTKGIK